MESEAVSVIGMGVVSGIGSSLRAFGESLLQSRSGIQRIALPDRGIKIACLAAMENPANAVHDLLSYEPVFRNLAAREIRRSSKSVQLSCIAMLQARQHCESVFRIVNPERIGLIVAGNNLSSKSSHELAGLTSDSQGQGKVLPGYFLSTLDTDHIGVLSQLCNAKGEGLCVGGASASGNLGLLQGLRMIRHGYADVCIVVGALHELSVNDLLSLQKSGALAGFRETDGPECCSPFDQSHQGFVYGEGAACLILSSAKLARKLEVPVAGHLLGGAICMDANRSVNPNVDGEIRVMQAALQDAGVSLADVDYINAHGSSSKLGDTTEALALETFLGEHVDRVYVNATKALTGHCLGASSVIEAVATLIQLERNFVHGLPNLRHPISSSLRFPGRCAVPAGRLQIGLSNAFAFSGLNSSIVFARGTDNFSWSV
jgi:malonyl-ACP decarboxylase